MSQDNRSRETVIKHLKDLIDQGNLSWGVLQGTDYGSDSSQIIYLQNDDYHKLAQYALQQNQLAMFEMIVSNQELPLAKELQLFKLKKEIEAGRIPIPNIDQSFACKIAVEKEDEESGYMSAPQDYARATKETVLEDASFVLSSKEKAELVFHALDKQKPETAQNLISQFKIMEDITELKQNSGYQSNKQAIEVVVSGKVDELKLNERKQQLKSRLSTLKGELKSLDKHYTNKQSGWIFTELYAQKSKEANAMIKEIDGMIAKLENPSTVESANALVVWDLTKDVFKDGKQLMEAGDKLNELKRQFDPFLEKKQSQAADCDDWVVVEMK